MPRHAHRPARRGLGWLAGAAVLTGAAISALALSPASPAAAAPDPNYHPGSDNATFTVTGVLDSNCLVSTGGTEIWIKPGDSIKFDSSLVGVNVASLPLHIGGVAGLNVSAVIDPGKSDSKHLTVTGGKTVKYSGAANLSKGDHVITWQSNSVQLLSALKLPLSQSNLKSGASLSWRGVIHVTDSAPQCKLTVGTPKVKVSVGPIKVTVPPVNLPGVSVPTDLPSVPNLNPSGGGKTHTPSGGIHYTPPPVSVPDRVVPKGDTGAIYPGGSNTGYYGGSVATGGGGGSGGSASSVKVASTVPVTGDGVHFSAKPKAKTVDLASSEPKPSGEIPVLLAIGAILALALVAGLYARLYLLRRT